MPRNSRGGRKRNTARPAKRRPKPLSTTAEAAETAAPRVFIPTRSVPVPATISPRDMAGPSSPAKENTVRDMAGPSTSLKRLPPSETPDSSRPLKKRAVCDPACPSTPVKLRIAPPRSPSAPPPPLPPVLQTLPSPPPLPQILPTASTAAGIFARGTESQDAPLNSGVFHSGMNETPSRRRRQPQRNCAKKSELPETPQKKSIFEGISRDSLQRYMVHYKIRGRQDLKKNLARRVQEHFDKMDANEIDLVELNKGVQERLTKLAVSSRGKERN